jgi:hypothetical protein
LGRFEPGLTAGMQRLHRLINAFYDRDFSFAAFLKEHPQYHDHLVRLLIGDVFNDQVEEIFSAMSTVCALPEPMSLP